MAHTIYFHPGLQKTATTSLQNDLFPKIDGVCFLGRSTQRMQHDNLYKNICTYCFSENSKSARTAIREDIESLLNQTDILLSEEWFLTDYDGFIQREGLKWQEKVERFFKLTKGFRVKVILSTRAYAPALFSLYCQNLQRMHPLNYGTFDQFIEQSNDVSAYDYGAIKERFIEFGAEVAEIDFELIKAGGDALDDELSDCFDRRLKCQMGVHNNIKKDGGDVVLITKPTWFGWVLRRSWTLISYTPLKLLAQKMRFNLDDLVVAVSGRKEVPKLTEEQIERINKKFAHYQKKNT